VAVKSKSKKRAPGPEIKIFRDWLKAQIELEGGHYGAQSDAARHLGLGPYEVNKISRGDAHVGDVRISTLARIAKARGVSLGRLADEIWPPPDAEESKPDMKMALANAMNNAGIMRTVVKIVRLLTEKSPRDAIPEVVALLNENEPTKPVQRQRLAKVLDAAIEDATPRR
jgi:transcriptional regulator with XRE-family HTH domain